MTTATVTFSAHLLPEYTDDSEFMSLLSEPAFGDIAVSTLWAMHKYTKDKNGSVPASVLGDERVIKMIETIRHDSDVKRAVLEERLANERTKYEERIILLEEQVAMKTKTLEDQIAFERNRCDAIMDVKGKQNNSSYHRGLEGEQMVFDVLSDELRHNKDYTIENHSKIWNEADIHVVNTRKKSRIVIEVKNKQAIDTDDVSKVYDDIEHLKVKYSDESIGYVFLSVCGKPRIPTKGFGCLEFVDNLPVIWTSVDVAKEGYATLRAIVMDRVEIIEGLAAKPSCVVESVEKDESMCELEQANNILKALTDMHEVELKKAYKSFMKMERDAKVMERDAKTGMMSIAKHLKEYFLKEYVSKKIPCGCTNSKNDDTVVGPEVTKQEMF
jgi:hypothetical protein